MDNEFSSQYQGNILNDGTIFLFQTFFYGVAGEALIMRLRLATFRALLRQVKANHSNIAL
jgi:hypothetical protein